MADWKGVVLRLIESSADLLRDIAIFLGSFQVKRPSSKSKAKELLVTSADQFFFFTFLFILKEIIAYFEQSEKQKENQRKGIRKRTSKVEEIKRLVKFYHSKGFKEKEAEIIANKVFSSIAATSELSVGEEVGLTQEDSWSPVKSSALTGLSFAIVSLIPILPFAFMSLIPAALTAVLASIATLFVVGASKAIFTRKSWIRSGLEMMGIGILAAAVTYAIGLAIPA